MLQACCCYDSPHRTAAMCSLGCTETCERRFSCWFLLCERTVLYNGTTFLQSQQFWAYSQLIEGVTTYKHACGLQVYSTECPMGVVANDHMWCTACTWRILGWCCNVEGMWPQLPQQCLFISKRNSCNAHKPGLLGRCAEWIRESHAMPAIGGKVCSEALTRFVQKYHGWTQTRQSQKSRRGYKVTAQKGWWYLQPWNSKVGVSNANATYQATSRHATRAHHKDLLLMNLKYDSGMHYIVGLLMQMQSVVKAFSAQGRHGAYIDTFWRCIVHAIDSQR